jgi:hypothetical protein
LLIVYTLKGGRLEILESLTIKYSLSTVPGFLRDQAIS